MSDQHVSASEWLSIVATSMLTGIGSAMAWFSGTKKTLEARMVTYEKTQADHQTELAVIASNHDHLSSRMDEVRELGLSAHRKLDEVLMEVRRH